MTRRHDVIQAPLALVALFACAGLSASRASAASPQRTSSPVPFKDARAQAKERPDGRDVDHWLRAELEVSRGESHAP